MLSVNQFEKSLRRGLVGHAAKQAEFLSTCTAYRHKLGFIVSYQVQFCITVTRRLGGEGNVDGAAVAGRQRSGTEALEREVAWLIPGDGEACDVERRQAHVL